MATMTYTLRALSFLLRYPDAGMRRRLGEAIDVVRTEAALPASRIAELARLADRLAVADPLAVEGDYVDTFDRGRRTALNL